MGGESWLFTSHEIEWIEQYVQGFSSDSPIDQRVEIELTRLRTGIHQGRAYVTLRTCSERCRLTSRSRSS